MPLEVGRHSQQVLVTDAPLTARTRRRHRAVVVGHHGWSRGAVVDPILSLRRAVHASNVTSFADKICAFSVM